MRRIGLEDLVRTAVALAAVPRAQWGGQVQIWLTTAHVVDKARKRGHFQGPGDLASVLPRDAFGKAWRGDEADLARLQAVLAAIAWWRAQRRDCENLEMGWKNQV